MMEMYVRFWNSGVPICNAVDISMATAMECGMAFVGRSVVDIQVTGDTDLWDGSSLLRAWQMTYCRPTVLDLAAIDPFGKGPACLNEIDRSVYAQEHVHAEEHISYGDALKKFSAAADIEAETPITAGVLPIVWQPAELTTSRYATNMVCQYSGHEYILSFFETKPPLSEPVPARYIPAECVARIIIIPERLREFAAVINEMIEEYGKASGVQSASVSPEG